MNKNFHLLKFISIIFFSTTAYSSSSSYLIANSAVNSFDYENANIYYEVLEIDSFNISDLNKKLLTLINLNLLKEATLVAKKILSLDPSNEEAWIVELVYAKLLNFEEVFHRFSKINKKEEFKIIDYVFFENNNLKRSNEDIARSIFDIVQLTFKQDKKKKQNYNYLLFYLSLIATLDSNFNESYFYSALIYEELKNYSKAEAYYLKIKSDNYLFLESQKKIAINKSYIGNSQETENLLLSLIKLNNENEDLIISLADFYRNANNFKKAIFYYTKILDNSSYDKDLQWIIFYKRGICYEQSNKWENAEDDFLNALQIKPNAHQVLNYLAYGWLERNQFLNKSLEMLILAYEKNPQSHYILDSLAWAYYKKNNFKEASNLMEKVISMAPGEVISLDHLGDIYFAMGRKREAKFIWIQAMELAEPGDKIIPLIEIKIEKINAG